MATSAAGQPVRLNDQQIDAALKNAPEWALVGESIQRTYQFTDFVQAMKFVDEVAQAAEAAQHHPDILIRYSRVTLTLATHDSGGITVKDFDLATKADMFSSKHVVVTKPKTAVVKSVASGVGGVGGGGESNGGGGASKPLLVRERSSPWRSSRVSLHSMGWGFLPVLSALCACNVA